MPRRNGFEPLKIRRQMPKKAVLKADSVFLVHRYYNSGHLLGISAKVAHNLYIWLANFFKIKLINYEKQRLFKRRNSRNRIAGNTGACASLGCSKIQQSGG